MAADLPRLGLALAIDMASKITMWEEGMTAIGSEYSHTISATRECNSLVRLTKLVPKCGRLSLPQLLPLSFGMLVLLEADPHAHSELVPPPRAVNINLDAPITGSNIPGPLTVSNYESSPWTVPDPSINVIGPSEPDQYALTYPQQPSSTALDLEAPQRFDPVIIPSHSSWLSDGFPTQFPTPAMNSYGVSTAEWSLFIVSLESTVREHQYKSSQDSAAQNFLKRWNDEFFIPRKLNVHLLPHWRENGGIEVQTQGGQESAGPSGSPSHSQERHREDYSMQPNPSHTSTSSSPYSHYSLYNTQNPILGPAFPPSPTLDGRTGLESSLAPEGRSASPSPSPSPLPSPSSLPHLQSEPAVAVSSLTVSTSSPPLSPIPHAQNLLGLFADRLTAMMDDAATKVQDNVTNLDKRGVLLQKKIDKGKLSLAAKMEQKALKIQNKLDNGAVSLRGKIDKGRLSVEQGAAKVQESQRQARGRIASMIMVGIPKGDEREIQEMVPPLSAGHIPRSSPGEARAPEGSLQARTVSEISTTPSVSRWELVVMCT
ncbi:hypothetical protein DL93DRAFT_2097532 [Clavulina sp. PMI_390]|nr:hypothetical protein DL93DRAFT_2097532 [Clavulina sp. PMI_390]